MSLEAPNDIDRAAIEDTAQRVAEQTALRKVRKQLDHIEQGESSQRKFLRIVLIASAIAILGVAIVFWLLFFKDRDSLRGPPIQVPGSIEKKL